MGAAPVIPGLAEREPGTHPATIDEIRRWVAGSGGVYPWVGQRPDLRAGPE